MPSADDFQCLICHEVVRDCRSSSCCGALFCKECVDGNDIVDCPQCRKSDTSFCENKPMQRLVDDLDITCKDCKLVYKHKDNHGRLCPQKEENCFFEFLGCGWNGPRNQLREHLSKKHYPTCRKGHGLVRTPCRNRRCDICDQTIVVGGFAFRCVECDYDECPGCFGHRPIRTLSQHSSVGRHVEEIGSGSDREDTAMS